MSATSETPQSDLMQTELGQALMKTVTRIQKQNADLSRWLLIMAAAFVVTLALLTIAILMLIKKGAL